MINSDHINEQVNKTLNSLDGAGRARSNPFLFTRINARMQPQENGWGKIGSFISRPVVAIALLIIVMAVNTWSVFNPGSNDTAIAAENENTTGSEIGNAYNDYNVVASADNFENLINK